MKKNIIIFFILGFLLVSCDSEGLFEVDIDAQTKEKVYADVQLTRRALYDLYGRMREFTNDSHNTISVLSNAPAGIALLDNATDDGAGNNTRTGGYVMEIHRYVTGAIRASTNPVSKTHPWTWFYKAINNANTFLANVDSSPLTDAEKESSKKEARFLRAYYYHQLFRWFGPLVISTEELDPFAFETTERADLATTVKFIVDEFDALIGPDGLPDSYNAANYGRATRGMAMAFKARTLLYAASELHKESGVTWAEAAKAAKDLIDTNLYALHYDDNGDRNYARVFNTRVNKEIILSYLCGDSDAMMRCFPAWSPWNSNKELFTCATQWLVDSYDMLDGSEPITGYNGLQPIINPESGYDEQNPYANRDPRLDQTILHHNSVWPLVDGTPRKLDLTEPQKMGSGYFLLKWLDNRVDYQKGGKSQQNFTLMRYAEVLLNYAEAINEAENTNEGRVKAVAALNEIRKRAGITKDLDAGKFNQSTLRDRIRKERRVELCFEEHRFFDIRRWKIAKDVMNRPAVAISIQNGQFVRSAMDIRSYNERMDLMPLPMAEVNNCPLIYQNPGY